MAFELTVPKLTRDRSISHTFGFPNESLPVDIGLLMKVNPEIPD
jgi:hypothetical protein